MIQIQDLNVRKRGRVICRVERLQLASAGRLAVTGPNGSGKSTLLRVLAGLEPKHEGTCNVAAPLEQRVLVHQAPLLFRGTVERNIAFGLNVSRRRRQIAAAERRARLEDALSRFDLEGCRGQDARTLSGGERRRVALARAMILRPRLLLLDEPLADLDDRGAEQLEEALDPLRDTTIVIASPTGVPAAFGCREHPL